MPSLNSAALRTLDRLVRGEMEIVETYLDVLPGVADEVARVLTPVKTRHIRTVTDLREMIVRLGGRPPQARAAPDASQDGKRASGQDRETDAVRAALADAERRSLEAYGAALREPALPDRCRRRIRETLFPRQEANVAILDNASSP
jgi:hypothetical protein